jgi:flagellar M-ring protein FliF
VSSKTTTTVSDGFSVKKLFIAVLINRARLVADMGDKINQANLDSKIAEINQLAATAGGLDRSRGDQIQVTAVDFIENSREIAPVPPIGLVEMLNRQMGNFINAVTILAVAAMLVWFGLRPAVNGILTHRVQQEQAEISDAAAEIASAATMALPEGEQAELNLVEDLEGKMQRTPQKRLEQIVRLDHTQAAAILKQWIRREEAA